MIMDSRSSCCHVHSLLELKRSPGNGKCAVCQTVRIKVVAKLKTEVGAQVKNKATPEFETVIKITY